MYEKTNKEKKLEAGFREVYLYENRQKEGARKRSDAYLMKNRLCIKESIIDYEDTQKLKKLLTITKLDKEIPIVVSYEPSDLREYEYIYFGLKYRGFKEVYFTNDYKVSDLTEYIVERAKDDLKSKILDGRKEKIERGESMFTRCPYGYTYKNGKLRVNEYESFVVKYAFYRKSEGAGAKRIASELRARDFHNRKGQPIHCDNIDKIFANYRIYQGYVKYLGKEYYGNHQHFIDEEKKPIGKFGERLSKADLKISREVQAKLDKFKLNGAYDR